jgi:hypothetical protein
MNKPQSKLEIARERWGAAMPEWISTLARACDGSSQVAVAKKLGVSDSQVSIAIGKTYAGNYSRLEARVRGELMNERVQCPVLGDITTRRCVDAQAHNTKANYAPTNGMRVELRRACLICPNANGGEKEAA